MGCPHIVLAEVGKLISGVGVRGALGRCLVSHGGIDPRLKRPFNPHKRKGPASGWGLTKTIHPLPFSLRSAG